MNIILTRQCSNSCPYCFAAPDRHLVCKPGHPEAVETMTVERARVIGKWLASEQPARLNLIGGEPFLNRDLVQIVSVFRQLCPDSKLTLFTGGLVKLSLLSSLQREDVGILVNVNEERDYLSSAAFDHVMSFIDRAISAGFQLGLGFNVWRMDFDPNFMPRLAHKVGRQGFRWTVANPSLGGTSCVVSPADFPRLSKRCTLMLRAAAEFELSPNLDCPLPVCFFDDEDLAWIARFHPNVVANFGSCSAPIDITPELHAMRCFSLSSLSRTPIKDHPSVGSVREWFREHLDHNLLSVHGIFGECINCTHYKTARCQGGCLAWRDVSQAAPESLAKRLYKLIEEGKDQQAITELEASSVWRQTTVALYLGALAARKLGERERMRRFASAALRDSSDAALKKRIFALLAN